MNRNCIPILVCAFALVFGLSMTATATPKWASLLFAGRQGGSASDWSMPGTVNYGGNARMQIGVTEAAANAEHTWPIIVTVTFPEPFEATPFCMVTLPH